MLVQQEAIVFIFIVCLKSALEGFRHTWTAHTIKYTRIGSKQVDKSANSFISREDKKKIASTDMARTFITAQNQNVPRMPNTALIVFTPSFASDSC